jgi:GxxExxY protein
MTENQLATRVLDYAFEVHRALGPGLLESAYQHCLYHELKNEGFEVQKEVVQPIKYKDLEIEQGYRIDLLVENKLVIELKATKSLEDKHIAQTLTYLRLGGYRLGLLINFNEKMLKDGIKRIVNNL